MAIPLSAEHQLRAKGHAGRERIAWEHVVSMGARDAAVSTRPHPPQRDPRNATRGSLQEDVSGLLCLRPLSSNAGFGHAAPSHRSSLSQTTGALPSYSTP